MTNKVHKTKRNWQGQRLLPAAHFHEKAVKLLFRGTSIYLVGG
jgi:hypothetical protein